MHTTKRDLFGLAALLSCSLIVSGCAPKDSNPIPPAGTSVTTTSEVFRQTASGLQQECERIGGCTCILDGIQTTCAVVFACLDAGFCVRVASE
jgi:hypothetical protein